MGGWGGPDSAHNWYQGDQYQTQPRHLHLLSSLFYKELHCCVLFVPKNIFEDVAFFEMLESQIVAKYRETPHTLHPVSPSGHIAHNCSTISKRKTLTLVQFIEFIQIFQCSVHSSAHVYVCVLFCAVLFHVHEVFRVQSGIQMKPDHFESYECVWQTHRQP